MELDFGQPKVSNTTNILDIEVPPEMEHAVSSGHPHVDVMFAGDGLIPSTGALVTGLPGAGKTTLMLQLADSARGKGHVVLYNTGEESLFQVRRTTKRLGLRFGFTPSYHRTSDKIIEQLRELKEDNPGKQIWFIQDSLQCLEPSPIDLETGFPKKGRPKTGLNGQAEAVQEVLSYIKESFGIFLLIGQVTKAGEFAGKNAVKHMLDCHLHLGLDMNKKSETYGGRIAEMQKNRFGPAGMMFGFELESGGLKFETP